MSQRNGPRPLPRSFVGELFHGLGYPFQAVGFMRQHNLWRLALVPIIVNVLFFAGIVAAMIWVAVPWIHDVVVWIAPADPSGLLASLAAFAAVVIWIVAVALGLVAGAFILVMIGQAVASPFLDMLSEKVETIVLGTRPEPFTVARTVRAIIISLGDLFWSVLIWLAGTIPLIFLNVIPGLGAVLEFCFGALLLAQEFMGLSLARQLVSYPARWRVMWGNKWLSLGFGTGATLLLIVPGLNLVLLPLAAVGGTLLYCDLEAAGRVRPALPGRSASAERVAL